MKAIIIISMKDFNDEITLGTQYQVTPGGKKTVHFARPKEMDYCKYCVQTTKRQFKHQVQHIWRGSQSTGILTDINKNIKDKRYSHKGNNKCILRDGAR